MGKEIHMDWVDVAAVLISLGSLAFNIWLSWRNWNHRPSVQWDTPDLSIRDRERLASHTVQDGRTVGLLLGPDEQYNVYNTFRLMNNGTLQASDVRLYAYDCEFDAVQRLSDEETDEIRGTAFSCVRPSDCVFVRLWKPGHQVSYSIPDLSARFCVYWREAAHRPDYMRQDFKWTISSSGRVNNTIEPLGHPKRVSEKEHRAGAPLVNEYKIRGFSE